MIDSQFPDPEKFQESQPTEYPEFQEDTDTLPDTGDADSVHIEVVEFPQFVADVGSTAIREQDEPDPDAQIEPRHGRPHRAFVRASDTNESRPEGVPSYLSGIAIKEKNLFAAVDEADRRAYEGPKGMYRDVPEDEHPAYSKIGDVEVTFGQDGKADIEGYFRELEDRLLEHDPEYLWTVSHHIDRGITTAGQISELQERHGEAMAADRDEAFGRLAADIDWGGVVKALVDENGEWPENTLFSRDETINELQTLMSGRKCPELHEMYQNAQSARALYEHMAAVGGVLKEPTPEPEGGWYTNRDVAGEVDRWQQQTDKLIGYVEKVFQDEIAQQLHIASADLGSLQTLANKLGLSGPDEAMDAAVLTPIADACARRADHQFREFDNKFEAIIGIKDTPKEPKKVKILAANADKLSQSAGIENVGQWVTWQMSRFGRRMVSGIETVRFVDEAKSKDDLAPGENSNIVAGGYIPKGGILEIDVLSGVHADLMRHHNKTVDEAQSFVREDVEESFDHEVGHSIHNKVLTLEELRAWQVVLEAEPDPNISEYIKGLEAKKTKSKASQDKISREQFATTTSLYMRSPVQTAIDYGERFAFFNGIIGRYDTQGIQGIVRKVKNMRTEGKSEVEISSFVKFMNKVVLEHTE